jgi:hypothetical protein
MKLSGDEYQGVLDFSNDTSADIKEMMKEIESINLRKKKKKGK